MPGTHTVLAVRAITADGPDLAQELADAMLLWWARKDLGPDGPIPSADTTSRDEWTDAERTRAKACANPIIAGTPDQVHAELTTLAESHGQKRSWTTRSPATLPRGVDMCLLKVGAISPRKVENTPAWFRR